MTEHTSLFQGFTTLLNNPNEFFNKVLFESLPVELAHNALVITIFVVSVLIHFALSMWEKISKQDTHHIVISIPYPYKGNFKIRGVGGEEKSIKEIFKVRKIRKVFLRSMKNSLKAQSKLLPSCPFPHPVSAEEFFANAMHMHGTSLMEYPAKYRSSIKNTIRQAITPDNDKGHFRAAAGKDGDFEDYFFFEANEIWENRKISKVRVIILHRSMLTHQPKLEDVKLFSPSHAEQLATNIWMVECFNNMPEVEQVDYLVEVAL